MSSSAQIGMVGCINAIERLRDGVRSEMTLERAVQVLNERRHCGFATWAAHDGTVSAGWDDVLTHFEAIAVAEKLERQ